MTTRVTAWSVMSSPRIRHPLPALLPAARAMLNSQTMQNACPRRHPSRRAMLRWTLGSALGLAFLPSIASAQAAVTTAPGLPVPDALAGVAPLNGGPTWAMTIGEASLRGQPGIADNRFGFARAGTRLQVLGTTGDWAYVYNPHTRGTAYVSNSLLAPGDAPSPFVSL